MIDRYTRPEMGALWSEKARFDCLLEVEQTVAEVEAELSLIPREAAQAIRKMGRYDLARVREIELTTKHDVIAFVSCVAENVGEHGRWIHFGLTSSDALDTALSLQVKRARPVLEASLQRLLEALKARVRDWRDQLCAGRTHGMHAEPTTLGFKFAGFAEEFVRRKQSLGEALDGLQIAKLSGAVGTYSSLSYTVEEKVAERLGLVPERIATQVIPRDRHAQLMLQMALTGAAIERVAVELRHLQRTEVGEVLEGFGKGQKGSSAMPHKRNPISAENLTGCARLLRGYATAALEDVALWHERDISHSAVERVIFPDAFILLDYALDRLARVVEGLEVVESRVAQNLELAQGQLMSSHLLLALVEGGLSRETAYALVQRLSHGLKPGEHLREASLADTDVRKILDEEKVRAIFRGERHREAIAEHLARLGL